MENGVLTEHYVRSNQGGDPQIATDTDTLMAMFEEAWERADYHEAHLLTHDLTPTPPAESSDSEEETETLEDLVENPTTQGDDHYNPILRRCFVNLKKLPEKYLQGISGRDCCQTPRLKNLKVRLKKNYLDWIKKEKPDTPDENSHLHNPLLSPGMSPDSLEDCSSEDTHCSSEEVDGKLDNNNREEKLFLHIKSEADIELYEVVQTESILEYVLQGQHEGIDTKTSPTGDTSLHSRVRGGCNVEEHATRSKGAKADGSECGHCGGDGDKGECSTCETTIDSNEVGVNEGSDIAEESYHEQRQDKGSEPVMVKANEKPKSSKHERRGSKRKTPSKSHSTRDKEKPKAKKEKKNTSQLRKKGKTHKRKKKRSKKKRKSHFYKAVKKSKSKKFLKGVPLKKVDKLVERVGSKWAGQYKCKVCEYQNSRVQRILKHVVLHVRGRKFFCQKCGRIFRSKVNFDVHTDFHESGLWQENDEPGTRLFACEMCHQIYPSKEELSKHTKEHTEDLPYVCGVCGQTFKYSFHRSKHEFIHRLAERKFKCQICDKAYACADRYKFHVKVHKMYRKEISAYQCNQCPDTFLTMTEIRCHLNSHSLTEKCEKCGRNFAKLGLAFHQRNCNGPKTFKPDHLCDLCGKVFIKKLLLNRHMATVHTKERPHKCKYCDMHFQQTGTKQRHEKLHFKDGKYREVMRHQRKVEKGRDGRKYAQQ